MDNSDQDLTLDEWKKRYIARLMQYGLPEKDAREDCNAWSDRDIDLGDSPEEAADTEISYMGEDS